MNLARLNSMPVSKFVDVLGAIFEHSPWVAECAVGRRPYNSTEELHQAMCEIVARADDARQLALINAHPDLAGKAALAGDLTQASTNEQAGAGLDQMSDDEFKQFHRLNDAYQSRFGFPFIIAVKGHTRQSILKAFKSRLENDQMAEKSEALVQIYRIAKFRLEALEVLEAREVLTSP